MLKKTLIIQGGGFRTSFTAGVLDAFRLNDYNPFNSYVAVSGGAVALSYYLSSQYKHYYDAMCLLAQDDDFMNFNRIVSARGVMNVDCFKIIALEKIPFDIQTAMRAIDNKKLAIVMTNRTNGTPHYFNPAEHNWIDAIIATCTMPFVTKGRHSVEGVDYMDGGWSDPIPVEWAVGKGADDIVVIRTSPASMKMNQTWTDYFGSFVFRSNTKLKACFENNHLKYNASVDFIHNPPNGIKVVQIAPVIPLKTGTYSNSIKLITEDYNQGVACGQNYIQSLK